MKMNEKQVAVMAAVLGISNAGMDGVFIGTFASVTPEDVKRHYLGRNYGDLVESAVISFGSGFFESEEMAAGFIDEAKSWVKRLKKMDSAEVAKTWPRYSKFVDAIMIGS